MWVEWEAEVAREARQGAYARGGEQVMTDARLKRERGVASSAALDDFNDLGSLQGVDATPATPAAGDEAAVGGAGGWVADWGRLLRIARQVAGFSLTDLSTRTGLSKGYLSKLESGALGAANPSRATLAALARALPSFRPLALTLAPGLGVEELAFEGIAPHPTAAGPGSEPTDPARLRLGWKEMEVLAALMVLEAAALPYPLSATLIARAVERTVESVRPVLAQLCRSGLVRELPPASAGQRATYLVVEAALRQAGAARVGDLLLLATALLGASLPDQHGTRTRVRRIHGPDEGGGRTHE